MSAAQGRAHRILCQEGIRRPVCCSHACFSCTVSTCSATVRGSTTGRDDTCRRKEDLPLVQATLLLTRTKALLYKYNNRRAISIERMITV